ncbi:hypothetical protein [Microbacterium sp. ISL-59]|uniref:hypothetical protein n=1 Tax=Microbacterium sp. ISL-59 TaxID=2819159 RepID=UPI00203598F5|nr:hypothetical protein [Microbacterium sp. ISL-59]
MTITEVIVHAAIDNPLDGVLPDFSIFGVQFTALWQKVLAGIWGLALVFSVGYLIWGIVQMGKSDDGNPNAYKQGRKAAMAAGIALACLAGLTVIVGAILFIVGG